MDTIRTLTPGAISYVIRRAQTVLRQVDDHQALHGTALGTPPLDAAVRHSGTDVVSGAVGAYSIRHGDADENSERQRRDSLRTTLRTPEGGVTGSVRKGELAHGATYFSHRTYVRWLPPTLQRPAVFYGDSVFVTRNGQERATISTGGRPRAEGSRMDETTGAERTYLSRQRTAARKENPNATPAQIEAVAWSALDEKRAREAKPQTAVTGPTVTVDDTALAVAADRGW